jgi:hypothetical protein
VCRSDGQIEVVQKQLVRILHSETGRVIQYPIGNSKTARFTARLFHYLPDGDGWVDVHQLITRSNLDPWTVRKLLHVMHEYSVIKHSDQ